MKKIFLVLIFVSMPLLFCNWDNADISKKYLVIVPSCDACTSSIKAVDSSKSAKELYDSLPYSPESGVRSCYRANQLLFNEVVDLKNFTDEEAEFEVANAFYEDSLKNRFKTFWTLNKNLKSLKEIKFLGIDIEAIPNFQIDSLKDQLVILDSFSININKEKKEKICFSIGTRFVRLPQFDDKNNLGIKFLYLDKNNDCKVFMTLIPKAICITEFPSTNSEKINLFVSILKNWTDNKNGFIAYSWGGNSACKRHKIDKFEQIFQDRSILDKISFWIRHGKEAQRKPHSGFDCACLVLRAAQLAGIPYYYKTTTTIAANLKELKAGESISNGDLIWHSGHVMVIVDVEKNLVVEATGYTMGYGKVHMLEIEAAYKNIKTCRDLFENFINKSPLLRLDSQGKVIKKIKEFKIFRFSSVFELN